MAMTEREVMTAIINGELTPEMYEYATARIEKINASNAKRKEKNAEKRQANAGLVKHICTVVLSAEPMLASEIAAATGLSTSKVTALMKMAADFGYEVIAGEARVKGSVRKTYAIAE